MPGIQTFKHEIHGETIFVCPYSGRTRFHRFGFPKYAKGEFKTIMGSYTTYGCGLAHLQTMVAKETMKEKKAIQHVVQLSKYLSSFKDSDFTVIDAKTCDSLSEAIQALGIEAAPDASLLRLFGGQIPESKWVTMYDEATQIHLPGFELGYMFGGRLPVSDETDQVVPEHLSAGSTRCVTPSYSPPPPSKSRSVTPPYTAEEEGELIQELSSASASSFIGTTVEQQTTTFKTPEPKKPKTPKAPKKPRKNTKRKLSMTEDEKPAKIKK